jgi:PRD1 phage membrane DNA delivery
MSSLVESLTTIVLAIVGLAIVSVLVSKNAQTSSVLQAGFSGIANNLGVAESPVTGANISYTTGYPASNNLSVGFGS